MTRQFTDEELNKIVFKISQPIFKYFIKRFVNQMPNMQEINMNDLFAIFLGSMAAIDANLLKWADAFHKNETGKDLDFSRMKMHFIKLINEQTKINLH